jgi:hypothetical protein
MTLLKTVIHNKVVEKEMAILKSLCSTEKDEFLTKTQSIKNIQEIKYKKVVKTKFLTYFLHCTFQFFSI